MQNQLQFHKKGGFRNAKAMIINMVYKIIAFIILAAFYGCYFIKMLSQFKKGIKTDRLGRGKSGSVKLIEISVKIASLLCPTAEIVSIILGVSMFSKPWRITGACIGALGAVVFIISVITMSDSWRAGVPEKKETRLVTGGIYKISRNPAFLGFDLVYIGILLIFFNYWLFAITVVTVIMFHLQIVNVEEDFLTAEFGEEYLIYKNKVCRYIGRKLHR